MNPTNEKQNSLSVYTEELYSVNKRRNVPQRAKWPIQNGFARSQNFVFKKRAERNCAPPRARNV